MAWKGTLEERRRYAQKKAAQRKKVTGVTRLTGYEVAPDQHRCTERTVKAAVMNGTPILGRRCHACGREWRYSPNPKTGWPYVEITPLTVKCPPQDVVATAPALRSAQPSGRLGELPPEDLGGAARGRWWKEYGLRRQERRQAAQEQIAS